MLFFGSSASKYPCCPQSRASLVAQVVTNPPAVRETRVRSLGQEDPLEERMATHSSVLAWRVPWTQELAGYSPRGCKESVTTERHTHTVYCKSDIGFHLDSAAGGGGPPSHTHAHTHATPQQWSQSCGRCCECAMMFTLAKGHRGATAAASYPDSGPGMTLPFFSATWKT